LVRLPVGNTLRLFVPKGICRVRRVSAKRPGGHGEAWLCLGHGAGAKLAATLDNVPALAANSGHALP
jgi:hypothetical protein